MNGKEPTLSYVFLGFPVPHWWGESPLASGGNATPTKSFWPTSVFIGLLLVYQKCWPDMMTSPGSYVIMLRMLAGTLI